MADEEDDQDEDEQDAPGGLDDDEDEEGEEGESRGGGKKKLILILLAVSLVLLSLVGAGLFLPDFLIPCLELRRRSIPKRNTLPSRGPSSSSLRISPSTSPATEKNPGFLRSASPSCCWTKSDSQGLRRWRLESRTT